jgi:hypothetical protein
MVGEADMNRSSAARLTLALLLIGALAGCSAPVKSREIALPSGEKLEVINEKFDSFTNVSGEPKRIYSIEYVTPLPMTDVRALIEEAHEVLVSRDDRIGKADYTTVVITPMKRTTGGSLEGYPMYFKRSPDGVWIMERER